MKPAGDLPRGVRSLTELAFSAEELLQHVPLPVSLPEGDAPTWSRLGRQTWALHAALSGFSEHVLMLSEVRKDGQVDRVVRHSSRPVLRVPEGWRNLERSEQVFSFLKALLGVHLSRQWTVLGWGVERLCCQCPEAESQSVDSSLSRMPPALKVLDRCVRHVGGAAGYYQAWVLLPGMMASSNDPQRKLQIRSSLSEVDRGFDALERVLNRLSVGAGLPGAPAYAREAWRLLNPFAVLHLDWDEGAEPGQADELDSVASRSEPAMRLLSPSPSASTSASGARVLSGIAELLAGPPLEPITSETLEAWEQSTADPQGENLAEVLLAALQSARSDRRACGELLGLEDLSDEDWKELAMLPLPDNGVELIGAFLIHRSVSEHAPGVYERVDAVTQWMLRALHQSPLIESPSDPQNVPELPSLERVEEWQRDWEPLLQGFSDSEDP